MQAVIVNHSLKIKTMKKSIKYMIKLFFVIILPIISSAFVFIILSGENPIRGIIPVTVIIATLFAVYINAFIYVIYMPKTKLIPGTIVTFMPIIGFAVGYDATGLTPAIVIIIPFCTIEFKLNKQK
jgi:hypothetical protein